MRLSNKRFPFLEAALMTALLMGGLAMAGNPDANATTADARFVLRSATMDGLPTLIGAGGDIDRVIYPDLRVKVGDVVEIVFLNGDGAPHVLTSPDFEAQAPLIVNIGDRTILSFTADKAGTFWYHCYFEGHKLAGMLGQLIVEEAD